MKELVECIAKTLVDDPDAVSVRVVKNGEQTVLELSVGAGDYGKVIGKQGRTAQALRTVVGAAGAKLHQRVVLEIVE